MRMIFALSLIGAAIATPTVAPAQQRLLTIFGDDKCPSDTICVVAPESERYRIPGPLRERNQSPDSQSWAMRSQATLSEGKTGTNSCSTVGPGGWTGCWMQQMQQYADEAKAREAGQVVIP